MDPVVVVAAVVVRGIEFVPLLSNDGNESFEKIERRMMLFALEWIRVVEHNFFIVLSWSFLE